MNNKILFPFIALCLIWGSTWYFIKISLNAGVPPFYGVGLRFLFSGIIFYLYIYFKKLSIPITPQAIKLYLSFGSSLIIKCAIKLVKRGNSPHKIDDILEKIYCVAQYVIP